jgi:hypothetical protein
MNKLKSYIQHMKNSLLFIEFNKPLSSDIEFTLLTYPILSRYKLYDAHFEELLEILYQYANQTDSVTFINTIDKLIQDEFK